jgi:hypothetical protein
MVMMVRWLCGQRSGCSNGQKILYRNLSSVYFLAKLLTCTDPNFSGSLVIGFFFPCPLWSCLLTSNNGPLVPYRFVCCGLVERSVGFSTRHHWALRLYSGGRCASQKRKEKRESTYGHVRARIGMNFDPSSMSFVV